MANFDIAIYAGLTLSHVFNQLQSILTAARLNGGMCFSSMYPLSCGRHYSALSLITLLSAPRISRGEFCILL